MRAKPLLLAATLIVAAAASFAIYRSVLHARPPTRHNVLLITLDTTRADHLGCYGDPDGVSPRLDALAKQGAVFTDAYSAASVTPVSHASIMTGQYPYTHGLRVLHGLNENRLPDQAVTLAEVLKDSGYKTAAFVSAFPAGSRFGLSQGFETFDEAFLKDPIERIVAPSGMVSTGKNQRRSDATTDLALSWLASEPSKFFLWLHYFDPHDVQVTPPLEFLHQFPGPSGDAHEQLRYVYDLEIRYMDQQIGRVFDALQAAGRLDDTVVVIVADHGQGLGDHNWWTHGILYQEQIRVPLIIRAPGLPADRRIESVARTIDIAPTVLELVGLDPRQVVAADGASLVPQLEGKGADPGYLAYSDSVNILAYAAESGTADRKDDMLFSVTDGSWKYIHHLIRQGESELYDLEHDPDELKNLYAERPPALERLWSDLKARHFQPDRSNMQGKMSAADLERLRSLGYVGEVHAGSDTR